MFFSRYVWPYPLFLTLFIIPLAGYIQLLLCKRKRFRWLIPTASVVCILCAVVALFTATVPGVLLGEIEVALTIGLPGITALIGSGIGAWIAWRSKRS